MGISAMKKPIWKRFENYGLISILVALSIMLIQSKISKNFIGMAPMLVSRMQCLKFNLAM